MSDARKYLKQLLAARNIHITRAQETLLNEFGEEQELIKRVQEIFTNQKWMMDKWKIKSRVDDILNQTVMIPNGTVGKPYEAQLDFLKTSWNDIIHYELEGLESLGLQLNHENELITGTPSRSGDIRLNFKFRIEGETEDSVLNEKNINLIINPDPKSLWKNLPSDTTDPYWKKEETAVMDKLGDRHILAASKRGRSHANVGSFRDDDFAYKEYPSTGWNIVVVADGAGSAKFSRAGSKIACASVVDFFNTHLTNEIDQEFESLLSAYQKEKTPSNEQNISSFIYQHLLKGAYYAHQQLADTALKKGDALKDYHTTLVFTLFKKYAAGYAFLSFGVGDCPMALLNKDLTELSLLNWIDTGDYGGGTRFITMPEIFSSDKLATRFRFKLVDDFSWLILMTDGIYDAKFVVEANLEKIDNWKDFLTDLKGKNEDGKAVDFDATNPTITDQLLSWMDFWSPGNHDDRTLAIVF